MSIPLPAPESKRGRAFRARSLRTGALDHDASVRQPTKYPRNAGRVSRQPNSPHRVRSPLASRHSPLARGLPPLQTTTCSLQTRTPRASHEARWEARWNVSSEVSSRACFRAYSRASATASRPAQHLTWAKGQTIAPPTARGKACPKVRLKLRLKLRLKPQP
jgi:hypothetical protein